MLLGLPPSDAETAFLRLHARYASRLRVIRRGDVVEVEGEVDSYYRKQLLLKDATAVWGASVVRAVVRVRRPEAVGDRPRS